jgi:hypothetical protein
MRFSNELDRTDSSGIRFYLGNELRQYDLGYLTLGTASDAMALAIPPRMDRLVIDSYCPALVTQVSNMSYNSASIRLSLSTEFSKNGYHSSHGISPYSSSR